MKMNKEEYEKLMKRFSLELSEVGVTEDLIKLIQAQCDRAPNVQSASSESTTDRFVYRHNGYTIEAERTVKLVVKTCK